MILERDHEIQKEDIQTIIDSESASIIIHREDINIAEYMTIFNTLKKDSSNSEKEALEEIYRQKETKQSKQPKK